MKRILAVLLVIVLSVALVPSTASAQGGRIDDTPYEKRYPQAIEIWNEIEQIENEQIEVQGASYTDAAEAAYAIVEASDELPCT